MSKQKTFAVSYNTTTSFEAVVKAENKKAAITKVKEVIGYPINIESAFELKSQSDKRSITK